MATKTKWQLIRYNKYQTGQQKKGKIILEGNNPNGFLEKIHEQGLVDYVFCVTRTAKGDIGYSYTIGTYEEDRWEAIRNADIAHKGNYLLDFIKVLTGENYKFTGKDYHTNYQRVEAQSKLMDAKIPKIKHTRKK